MATTNLGRIGLVSRGTWSAGTYKNLDVVSYNNSLYICKVTTTTDAPTVSASWDLYVSDSGAAASAAAAANSATAAAASYDSFDDRYLGVKTSDPSVDNDGNALLVGALYWNSATSVFKVWSGGAWITNLTSNQFGTNVATFLQTPSSANLAAALTDETGTGKVVFDTSPTFPAQINLTANSGYNIYASGTAGNYLAGSLGIGVTPGTGASLDIRKNITGAINSYGVLSVAQIQSDVTSNANIFQSQPSTQATAFTLGNLRHYYSNQSTFGAGSTVINQIGFSAESSLTGATNNYGFYGGIAAGTNRYNLYMAGTADNYLAGRLSIGGTNFGAAYGDISNQRTLTGATDTAAFAAITTIASDVTAGYASFKSQPATQAASFTLSSLYHFNALQYTKGAGSTISVQAGFVVDSSLTNGVNNYGFYGGLNASAGTTRYNLYMAGTADNFLAGNIGVGVAPVSSITAVGAGQTTASFNTSTGLGGALIVGDSGASAGNGGAIVFSGASTAWRFAAIKGMVTNGGSNSQGDLVFSVRPSATDATLTEAFRIGSSKNALFSGSVGIGSAAGAGTSLFVGKNLTGATTAFGLDNQFIIQSDVTSNAYGFRSVAYTQAASFTLSAITHYATTQVAFGAGSTVSNQIGFSAESSLTGATNNYGFYGGIAAGTNRYNLYMAGTADNYLAGSLGIGTSSPSASAILDAQSTTKGVRFPNMTTTQKNAVATPAAGLVVFDTTLSKLCVYTGAAWQIITSA